MSAGLFYYLCAWISGDIYYLTFLGVLDGRVSSGNALFVVMEEGSFPSVVFVFGLVLLQSRLVVVINLSE